MSHDTVRTFMGCGIDNRNGKKEDSCGILGEHISKDWQWVGCKDKERGSGKDDTKVIRLPLIGLPEGR